MGASNFHNEYASKIYTFAAHDYNGDDMQAMYDYEDGLENVDSAIKSGRFSGKYISRWGKDPLELRSYPSKIIGTICSSTDIAGCSIYVYVTALARSGYYTGANFDYFYWFEVDGTEVEIEEIIDPEAVKWISDTKDELTNYIEQVYSANCDDRFMVVATFSNGETIYKQID